MPHRTRFAPGVFTRMGYSQLAVILLLLLPQAPGSFVIDDAMDPQATISLYYQEWRDLLNREDGSNAHDMATAFATIVDRLFYLDDLAPRILSTHWATLAPSEQQAFVEALKSSLIRKTNDFLRTDDEVRPSLTLTSDDTENDAATLVYLLEREGQEAVQLTVHMVTTSGGRWQIADLEVGDYSMGRHYQDFAAELLDKYSPAYLIAMLGDYSTITLEDFESSTVGDFPLDWSWQRKDEHKSKPYRVATEDGNAYLEATDTGESVVIGRDIRWNLREYPYVSFRWRVHKIPEGGDERFDNKVDSAAGIYFVYRRRFGLIPESVKYVWSSTLPVGSAMQRKGMGKPWMVVAGSGSDGLGVWHTYVFNLYEAYEQTFGHKPPDRPIGIGILSDANSTHSHAYADYDDILVLREVPGTVDSGVHKILETYQR